MFKSSFLFILFLFFRLSLFAQQDSAGFYHFTTAQGLPTNNIYSVIVDHLGYVWMATDNGVVKYNGNSFRIFNTNDGLASNDIWRVYEDKAGRIWLLTNSYHIGYISGDIYHPIHLQNGPNYILPKQIADNGQFVLLWYRTKGAHNIAVIKDDVLMNFNIMELSAANDICFVMVTSDFTVLLFSRDGNIYRFNFLDSGGGKLISHTCGGSLRKLVSLNDVILSFRNKCYLYSTGTDHFEMLDPAMCTSKVVYLDKTDPDDKIVVAAPFYDRITLLTGKYLYTVKGAEVKDISRRSLPGFLHSKASWVYVEKGGIEWYCTYTEGLWLKHRNSVLSTTLMPAGDLAKMRITGVSGDTVFWWDNDKSDLVLTRNANIVKRINFRGMGNLNFARKLKNQTLLLGFRTSIYNYDLEHGKLKDIIFGESRPIVTHGLSLYSKGSGYEIMNDSVKYGQFRNSEMMVVLSDSEMLHFAFGIVGLLKLEKDSIWLSQILVEKPLGVLADPSGKFTLIYSKHNIYLFDKKWRKYRLKPEVLHVPGIDNILNILKTPDNDFIIHCEHKVFYFDYYDKKLTALHSNFNFAGSKSVIWKNYLIVVGSFGIAYAEINSNKTIGSFRLLANFKNSSYSMLQNCAVDSSGNLFITADKVTRRLSFTSILKDTNTFVVDRDTMIYFRFKTPFSGRISNNDTIWIDQAIGNITIDNINYFSGPGLQYHYKTPSGKWRTSPSGEIFLENIKAGEYYKIEFYVQDDFWTSDLISIYLYQSYFWYQTFLWRSVFWTIGASLFFLSLLIVFYLTRRYAAKANDKKRWQTELELRAVHSQINPHFIFNTLSTALLYISKQQSSEAYDHVSRFSKLLRGYLKSSRDRLIILADEINMLEQYIRLQKAGFQKPFDHEIHVDPALEAREIMIPSLLLQPIVENAINHGLFHKQGKGRLTLSFSKGKGNTDLICVIDDNGIGREQSKVIQRNLKLKKESYGTALTGDLINVIQKYEQMNIGIVYIDKDLPDTGTIVRLTIGNVKKVAEQETKR